MTNVEAALSQKAREVPAGSLRQTVLLSAKRFKSTWVELGKLLIKVRDEALFEGWGFDSFDSYCARELHIRKATADKLTRSFSFLAKHDAKEVQSDDIGERAPAFEVVEVLAGAEERGQLSSQEYRSIRDSIWNPQQPVSELKRDLVDRFPRPPPEPPGEAVQLRRLAGLSRKLAGELAAHKKVPKSVAERAAALAGDIEELASAQS
jgi:hypothetical protein